MARTIRPTRRGNKELEQLGPKLARQRFVRTARYPGSEMALPQFTLAAPELRRAPFDDEAFIFELKMDGFRGLAYTGKSSARLVSRTGHSMKRFSSLANEISVEINREAVLDGEIVVLDSEGRPRFYDLMRGRGKPVFYCFDVLWLDGEDLRNYPLLDRKRILRSTLPDESPVLLFANHIEHRGVDFFRLVCQSDLEGVVAKRKDAVYGASWFKVRNPVYSQYEGRRELFEEQFRRRIHGSAPVQ